MKLNLKINENYLANNGNYLLDKYQNHGHFHPGDSGIDLFCPETIVVNPHESIKIDFQIQCEAFDINLYNYILDIKNILSSPNYIDIKDIREDMNRIQLNEMPVSYYLYPRSSIVKTQLIMLNSTGIIDAGYRGNICAFVYNTSDQEYIIEKGDRLFQICSGDLKPMTLNIVNTLSNSQRGSGGFGSTNIEPEPESN